MVGRNDRGDLDHGGEHNIREGQIDINQIPDIPYVEPQKIKHSKFDSCLTKTFDCVLRVFGYKKKPKNAPSVIEIK